jgi:hypothetical protein
LSTTSASNVYVYVYVVCVCVCVCVCVRARARACVCKTNSPNIIYIKLTTTTTTTGADYVQEESLYAGRATSASNVPYDLGGANQSADAVCSISAAGFRT